VRISSELRNVLSRTKAQDQNPPGARDDNGESVSQSAAPLSADRNATLPENHIRNRSGKNDMQDLKKEIYCIDIS
jgi:hypothetical protein